MGERERDRQTERKRKYDRYRNKELVDLFRQRKNKR